MTRRPFGLQPSAFGLQPAGRAAAGFTLIEMLVVIMVAMILVTLSAGGIVNSLRQMAVQRAASDILTAANTARYLALQEDDTSVYYGVEVVDDGGTDGAYVAVITGSASAAPTLALSDEDRDEDGTNDPICRLPLSKSVVVHRGAADLRKVDSSQSHLTGVDACHKTNCVAWFYAGATGRVHARDSTTLTGLTDYTLSVGLKPETLDVVYGKDYGGAALPDIAPGEFDVEGEYHAGLSVRSLDDYYRYAIGIYPNGVGFMADFSAQTEGD